jgi:hypothetical protein
MRIFHNANDAMHMVGHDHKRIQTYAGMMRQDGFPKCVGYHAYRGQTHHAIHHIAKMANAILCANRQEIPSGCGEIPIAKSGGGDAVAVVEKRHDGVVCW